MTGNDRFFLGKDDAAIRRAPVVLSEADFKTAKEVLAKAVREFRSHEDS
jgi:hypothetical protein